MYKTKNKIVLTGGPCAGKTTAIQEIEKEFIGVHKDIEKNNTFYIKNYRVMEVTKNV